MNRHIFVLQNISREGPGLLKDILKESGEAFRIIDLSQELSLPAVNSLKALIILGGPDSANDETLKIQKQLQLINEAIQNKIPYLGICLGMQLLVKAHGGSVHPCHTKEIGFRDTQGNIFQVQLTQGSRNDPLFNALPDSFPIFHLHGETVQLTSDMNLLGIGSLCPVQVVKVGNVAYGIQGHVEITEPMLRLWLKEDPDLQQIHADELLNDYHALQGQLKAVATQLFSNFLQIVESRWVR